MITIRVGNIAESSSEVIVCNANTFGVLDTGIARIIKSRIGDDLVKEIKGICSQNKKLKEGDFFVTDSGDLANAGIKKIYHAVVSYFPGDFVSMYFIEKSLKSILLDAFRNKHKSIAIPNIGLDSGIDCVSVAVVVSKIVLDYCDKIDIEFIDTDKEFVDKLKLYLNKD